MKRRTPTEAPSAPREEGPMNTQRPGNPHVAAAHLLVSEGDVYRAAVVAPLDASAQLVVALVQDGHGLAADTDARCLVEARAANHENTIAGEGRDLHAAAARARRRGTANRCAASTGRGRHTRGRDAGGGGRRASLNGSTHACRWCRGLGLNGSPNARGGRCGSRLGGAPHASRRSGGRCHANTAVDSSCGRGRLRRSRHANASVHARRRGCWSRWRSACAATHPNPSIDPRCGRCRLRGRRPHTRIGIDTRSGGGRRCATHAHRCLGRRVIAGGRGGGPRDDDVAARGRVEQWIEPPHWSEVAPQIGLRRGQRVAADPRAGCARGWCRRFDTRAVADGRAYASGLDGTDSHRSAPIRRREVPRRIRRGALPIGRRPRPSDLPTPSGHSPTQPPGSERLVALRALSGAEAPPARSHKWARRRHRRMRSH